MLKWNFGFPNFGHKDVIAYHTTASFMDEREEVEVWLFLDNWMNNGVWGVGKGKM